MWDCDLREARGPRACVLEGQTASAWAASCEAARRCKVVLQQRLRLQGPVCHEQAELPGSNVHLHTGDTSAS